MSLTCWALAIIMGTPLWAACLHAMLSRTGIGSRVPRQKLALLSCLVTVTLVTYTTAALDFFLIMADGTASLFTVCISTLLAHIYFHVFNMSETARRVRILVDLKKRATLPSTYGNHSMVAVRLERLCQLGQIQVREGKLYSRPTLLRAVCKLVAWHEGLLFPSRLATLEPREVDGQRGDSL